MPRGQKIRKGGWKKRGKMRKTKKKSEENKGKIEILKGTIVQTAGKR
jgi:hypothetical protein